MSIIDEKIKYFNDDNFKPRIFPKPILHKIKLFVLIILFPQILYKYALYIYNNYHNNYEQLLIINQSNLLLITALLICFYAIFISPLFFYRNLSLYLLDKEKLRCIYYADYLRFFNNFDIYKALEKADDYSFNFMANELKVRYKMLYKKDVVELPSITSNDNQTSLAFESEFLTLEQNYFDIKLKADNIKK